MNQPTTVEPTPPPQREDGAIARYFRFQELGTDIRTEAIAGATTFFTMAYILVVNPGILSSAIFVNESGDLFGGLAIATAISAAIATLIMGLLANYPFALAPGMGLNAFFAFSVVLGLGIDWRVALGVIFIEGIIFILLTLSNLRAAIITAIPACLKHATAVGIGLFIAYIGLAGDPAFGGAGIIVANEATKTGLGDLGQPPTLMAIFGIIITAAFVARRIKGGLLWGIWLPRCWAGFWELPPGLKGSWHGPVFLRIWWARRLLAWAVSTRVTYWTCSQCCLYFCLSICLIPLAPCRVLEFRPT